jgi:putative ABC transport system permease protein
MRRARRALDGLDDDIRDHLERETQDNLDRGMSPEEAQRQAKLKFGNVALAKEDSRAVWTWVWLEQFLQDVRYALRTSRQLPGFAAIALLILALGVGATTVMFTVINSVLLRPLAYPEPHRLVTLHGFTEAFGESWGASYPDFIDVQRESRSLTMAAWRYGGGTISAPGDPEYVDGREISAELFAVLGLRLSQGRPFRADDDRPGAAAVAIISYSLWQRRYGGGAAIGQRLVFEGTPYTVVGVAPARFGLDGDVDVFTPLGQNTEPRMRNRQARFLRVTARLVRGAPLSEAQTELALIARGLAAQFPASNDGRGMLARPLQQDVVGDIGSTLWLLLAAVTLVLLIACVNVASLLLARAVSRERELATRVALGASRARVVRQCLTESGVLGLIGGGFGILLATVSVRPFVAFWPGALPRANEIQLDWRVLLAAFAVSLASGLAFGLAPALRVPMSGMEGALRGASRTVARSSRRVHSAFVVTQLALAVVLLVSAGMLARTLLTLVSLDPGLNVRNVLTARFALSPGVLGNPAQIPAAWQDVLDRARRVPGVKSAALTDIVPMREGENALPYWTTAAAPPPAQTPIALASSVTPDYLKVMGIPLRAGRFFDEHDRLDGEPVVIVDENLALYAFGRRDVVGRQLWVPAMGPAPVRIVGVVGHVRHWGLAADDRSQVRDQMYYPLAQVPRPLLRTFASFMSIAVRTSIAPLDIVEPLRRELRGTSGDQVMYEVRTMEQLVSGSLARQRFLALLFAIFGGLALLLACVGVYGVLAYLTGQRAREFGVRMALGATAGDVMRLVLRQSAVLILIGVVAGTCAAWAAARLLERSVEGIRAVDPATLAVMTSVLVVTALSASAIPAHRAGHADAIRALRHD